MSRPTDRKLSVISYHSLRCLTAALVLLGLAQVGSAAALMGPRLRSQSTVQGGARRQVGGAEQPQSGERTSPTDRVMINPQPLPPEPEPTSSQVGGHARRPVFSDGTTLTRPVDGRSDLLGASDRLRLASLDALAQPSAKTFKARGAGYRDIDRFQPGLHGVSGAGTSHYVFTPGGGYSFIGAGFGTGTGQVRLINRHLPGGHLDFVVKAWTDDTVTAFLPEDISGIPDLPVLSTHAEANGSYTSSQTDDPVALQLITQSGQIFTLDRHVSFFGVRVSQHFDPTAFPVDVFDYTSLDRQWATAIQTDGRIYRGENGSDLNCPNPGRDILSVRLKNGWAVTGFSVTATTPVTSNSSKNVYGDDGDTIYTGAPYTIAAASPATVEIDWGVLRSHRGHHSGFSYPPDECDSGYDVSFDAVGPVGTTPY